MNLKTGKLLVDTNLAQQFEIAEHFAGAEHHRSQGIVGNGNGKASFFADALIEIFQKRAPPGEDDAAIADVRGKFGRSAFQGHENRIQNCGNTFAERLANFAVVDGYGARHAFDQVAAFDFHGQGLFQGIGGADFHFDLFGGAFTDQQVVFAFQILHDGFVHLIAGDAYRTGIHDAAHGDDSDVRSAAADVHDHVATGLFDGQAGADGCSHGLFDEIHFAGSRAIGRILNGTLFHRGDFAGHTNDDAGMNQHATVVGLLNKVGEHFFGNFKISDHPIFHGLDGHHVTGSAAKHVFGFAADRDDFAAGLIDGDDGGLVHDDAFAMRKDQGVRGAQIDGQVGGEQTEHRPQVVTILIHYCIPPAERLLPGRISAYGSFSGQVNIV